MKRHERKEEKPPSPDDLWMQQTNERCARMMAHWLKHSVKLHREIRSLRLEEMKALATIAVDTWIVAVSKRAHEQPESKAVLIMEMYLG